MTQEEKIESYKDVIIKLYEIEGRTVSYISSLLDLQRNKLSAKIREWNLVKAQPRHVWPSTQKFINKHKAYIISQIRNNIPIYEIADSLGVSSPKLSYVIKLDSELSKEIEYHNSKKVNKRKEESKRKIQFDDLDGEIWKEILGFNGYYVSNMGRFKRYLPGLDCYHLLECSVNPRSGRLYVSLINSDGEHKNMIAARIVAHTFCEGYSDINNTVDHIDGNILNNKASNLEWVSQAENNRRKPRDKGVHEAYSKHGKFKYILLDSKYQFKTIRSLAKFLGVSETQAHRYIDGECNLKRKIELIY